MFHPLMIVVCCFQVNVVGLPNIIFPISSISAASASASVRFPKPTLDQLGWVLVGPFTLGLGRQRCIISNVVVINNLRKRSAQVVLHLRGRLTSFCSCQICNNLLTPLAPTTFPFSLMAPRTGAFGILRVGYCRNRV